MKLSTKQLTLLIGFIGVLAVSNVAFAMLWMSRDVNITGGVETVGSIEVYDEDGVTLLTSYEFSNFTGGVEETSYTEFFINNTGNQPVYIHWNISSSSLMWALGGEWFSYDEDLDTKYYFMIEANWTTSSEYIRPIGSMPQNPVYIPVGEGKHLRMVLWYTGTPITAETFTLTVTFYAEDS